MNESIEKGCRTIALILFLNLLFLFLLFLVFCKCFILLLVELFIFLELNNVPVTVYGQIRCLMCLGLNQCLVHLILFMEINENTKITDYFPAHILRVTVDKFNMIMAGFFLHNHRHSYISYKYLPCLGLVRCLCLR